MTLAEGNVCDGCGVILRKPGRYYTRVIAVEYAGGYDGVSEWRCPDCGRREGRWTGKVLEDGEDEPQYGMEADGV